MSTDFALLPDAATPLTLRAQAASTTARRRLAYDLQVQKNDADYGAAIAISAEVLGAGDIIGLDPGMIARVEPPRGAQLVEPNYMPFVEFVDADFPWRYSLAPATGGHPHPWLVLVALKANEFEYVAQGQAPLPRIRVLDAAKALPVLGDDARFHGHVHVATGAAPGVALQSLVNARPELCLSRSLCPRALTAMTGYFLFLVPTYEAGRLAGLGAPSAAAGAAYAWGATNGAVELPVYFQSTFTTGLNEDFEQLVKRLEPMKITASSTIGKPAVADASRPGDYPHIVLTGAKFTIQDALVREGAAPAAYETPPALATALIQTLAQVITGETQAAETDGEGEPDPLVAMPARGYAHLNSPVPVNKVPRLAPGGQTPATDVDPWYHRLNLDLAFRQAAGMGAETVRRNQEVFAAKCWDQYESVVAANRQIIQLQTANDLVEIISDKHFGRLPVDVAVSLSEPVHDFVRVDAGRVVADVLRESGHSRAFASRAMRSAVNKVAVGYSAPLDASQGATRRRDLVAPFIPGDLAPRDPAGLARSVMGLANTELAGLGAPPPGVLAVNLRARVGDLRMASLASIATRGASNANKRLAGGSPAAVEPAAQPVNSVYLAAHIMDFLMTAPMKKMQAVIVGWSQAAAVKAEPVLAAPVLGDPLVDYLRAFAGDSLLRSSSDLPLNAVAVVKENRPFIESFLCGANVALIQEMRWRRFPMTLDATVFTRFWNRMGGNADIKPIRDWNGELGHNAAAGDIEKLVLLIRAPELLRRGNVIIGLNHGKDGKWDPSEPDPASADDPPTIFPIFTGLIGTDVAYFGFDIDRAKVMADLDNYFFVIHEPPGRLRFGLDLAPDPSPGAGRGRSRFVMSSLGRRICDLDAGVSKSQTAPQDWTWDDLHWGDMRLTPSGYVDFVSTPTPSGVAGSQVAGLPSYWDANKTSASVARAFLQKAVAAVVPARRVLL